MIGIILAVIFGFWLTRGARGPSPLEGEARAIDYTSGYDAMGEPIERPDDALKPPD